MIHRTSHKTPLSPAGVLAAALVVVAVLLMGCSDDSGHGNGNNFNDNTGPDGSLGNDGTLPDGSSTNRDGGTGPDGSATNEGPDPLYEGSMANAVVPGWSSSSPRPLIVEARQSQSTDWVLSMARIHQDGSVADIVAEEVKVWGWASSSPCRPDLLYSGAMGANARIPDWSASAPRPVIVLAHQNANTDWVVSMARVHPDGTIVDIIADELRVWGWNTGHACPPDLQYDGPMSSAVVPNWSSTAPRPLLVEAFQNAASDWFVSMARIHANGSVSDIFADQLKVWGW